ncbi:MAG: UxaA family hydrolase [Candidatus Bathyarchaeia archaeon]
MDLIGYERDDGSVGVRNHVLVLPSVACAMEVAMRVANQVEGAKALIHHQGCTQMGLDLEITQRTLAALGRNPNVGAVLIVSQGCESVSVERLADDIAKVGKPVEIVTIQELGGVVKTVARGVSIARKMVQEVSQIRRKTFDVSDLTIGIKCGASDATSGIASNPAVGVASDKILNNGGTVIFGETTELIGAEHIIAKRTVSDVISKKIYEIVERMENRAKEVGVDMRGTQPTPGNIKGGLTTIEEKSLGTIRKAGTSLIQGVLEYAESPKGKGLYVMDTPGREPEALTGFVAGGAQILLFTTGRGATQGYPIVPVIKITGNSETYKKMIDDIDIDVSSIIEGKETIEEAGNRIYLEILKVASGKKTKAESFGCAGPADIYRIGHTF